MGILLPGTWRDYYNPLLKGLDEVCASKGFYLLLRSRDYLAEAEHMVREGRVDGFIIRNMDDQEGHRRLFASLKKRGIPFLLIGNPLPEFPSIKIDNIGGARKLAHHFAEHEFRRILFIRGPGSNIDSTDRFYGFKLGLTEHGSDPAGMFSVDGDYSTESGYAVMEEHFARIKPDAIFAANDRMALGALLFLRKHRVRVPEDVALAGFDDSFFAEHLSPPLTTVRQPIYEMGTIAMETMIHLLQDSSARDTHIILPAKLIVRSSCGCLSGDVSDKGDL